MIERKTLYLAGPMRGIYEFNFPAFFAAEARLVCAGFDVISPARRDEDNGFDWRGKSGNEDLSELGFDLKEALLWDLNAVAEADGVALLYGWGNSRGTKAEIALAQALDKPVKVVGAWVGEPIYGDPQVHVHVTDEMYVHNKEWLEDQVDKVSKTVPQGFHSSYGTYTFGNVEKVEDPYKKDDTPPRADVLQEAARLITGDRNNSYGPPTQDFRRTADALSALGYRRMDTDEKTPLKLVPSDVAIMVGMVKMSRLMHSRQKRDNWTDLAGYAGCGYECSVEEAKSA